MSNNSPSADGNATSPRLELSGLALLYVFSAIALIGFATFGLHPGLLARVPRLAGFFQVSFSFFAQAQIWLAAGVLFTYLWRRVRFGWVSAFLLLYVLSLASELLGTTVGLPFGDYSYTAALGPRWLGHVPIVIPLSWFFMALPSYVIARTLLGSRPLAVILVGSLILLSWDLTLDPAMSGATAYWVWGEPGAYYGMPWLNLFGWYVTGLVLLTALAWSGADRWIARLSPVWLGAFYGANLFLPLGMSAAAGMWGAVLATLAALVLCGGVTLGLRWQARPNTSVVEVTA
jgi:uncharacterized membrane protein